MDVTLAKDCRLREHDDAASTEGAKFATAFSIRPYRAVEIQPLPDAQRQPFGPTIRSESHRIESTVSLKPCVRELPLRSFVHARLAQLRSR